MSFDLKVIETGNGGDFVNLGNDLAVTPSISTMIYCDLFGGNVEANTEATRTVQQDFSWWGNKLLMGNNIDQQFNSNTERVLKETALNSSAIQTITSAIKTDLKFLSTIFTINVNVTLPYVDKVKIEINVTELDGSREGTLVINIAQKTGDFSILDFDVSDFLI